VQHRRAAVCKASIAAVVLALGIVSLVQESTNAMVTLPAGLRPALTMPAVETVALRKSVTVTRHVAVRHRGVTVRTRHVAVRHRGVMVRTRHVAVRHRGVAARRTHVAVGRRGAVAVKSAAVVRPVRPWVLQPYYGTVFDGVTLGAVIAATAVPMFTVYRPMLVLVEFRPDSRLLGLLPIVRARFPFDARAHHRSSQPTKYLAISDGARNSAASARRAAALFWNIVGAGMFIGAVAGAFFYEGPLFWGKVGIAVVGIVLALIFQRVGDRMLGYLRAP